MITSHPDGARLRQRLEVELDIVPPESCTCGVTEYDDEIVDVEGTSVGDRHHVDMVVQPSERCCQDDPEGCIVHETSDMGTDCPFRAFYDRGWIPRVEDTAGEHVRVATYLPDREALAEIIEVLKQTAEAFHVRRLTKIELDDDGTERSTSTLDLTGLTETQRRTAVRAVETGYYEDPRETPHDELADEMGISKSALSRRLNAVEAAVMKAAFAGMSDPVPS